MPAVWLEVDPAGMRVERTAVVEVPPDGDGWTVETLAGTEHVDERGGDSRLVPPRCRDGRRVRRSRNLVLVRSTVDDLEQDLDFSYDWQRFEHDLSIERGDGRDLGHER